MGTLESAGLLVLTCAIGIGISWSGWNCRSRLSATSYTMLGVVCKLGSVLINVAIWEKHATPMGIFWVGVCLCSSGLYKQAPLRSKSPVHVELPQCEAQGNDSQAECLGHSALDNEPEADCPKDGHDTDNVAEETVP